jgi:hypothetical protein
MTIVNNGSGRKDTVVIISNNDSARHNNLYETRSDNLYKTKSDNLYETRSDLKNGVTIVTEMTPGTQPLFFFDGKKITHDEMSKIDPATIESMNVLKGENAIVQYGDEGKNGVVLIKSKLPNALYVVNGKIMNDALKKVYPDDIETINVMKGERATKLYGEAGKNGVIEIVTKNKYYGIGKNVKVVNVPNKPETALYVVNGEIWKGNKIQISQMNPDDILSVNILKGEEATKKYGEKASAGVVEILTKKKIEDKDGPTIFMPPVIVKDSPEKFDKVFTVAQHPASFPGGADAWLKYLQRNLNLDVPVKNGAGEGKYVVELSFIVDEKGMLSNVKAIKDPGYGTAAEAIRMITKGPNWKPAQQNGHLVVSQTKQSITFVVSAE